MCIRSSEASGSGRRRTQSLPSIATSCELPGTAVERNLCSQSRRSAYHGHLAMDDFEQALCRLTLAPYIVKATALIGVRRRGGSNMFRHQLGTMAILLDYKVIDPVLLKASVIHDLFEDAAAMPGVSEEAIARIDSDGPAVFALVMEVTRRVNDGVKEPKADYLLRIMREGSSRARLLKLADRISNLTALGFVHDASFIRKYPGGNALLHPAVRAFSQR